MRSLVIIGLTAIALAGCDRQRIEERAREQAEKAIESMENREARALAQQLTQEQVQRAQEALTAAHEYMGPVDGKLDEITVNAIQAFQRSHGLRDDGMLNARTERLLREQLPKTR